jgi:hypothetical protein
MQHGRVLKRGFEERVWREGLEGGLRGRLGMKRVHITAYSMQHAA